MDRSSRSPARRGTPVHGLDAAAATQRSENVSEGARRVAARGVDGPGAGLRRAGGPLGEAVWPEPPPTGDVDQALVDQVLVDEAEQETEVVTTGGTTVGVGRQSAGSGVGRCSRSRVARRWSTTSEGDLDGAEAVVQSANVAPSRMSLRRECRSGVQHGHRRSVCSRTTSGSISPPRPVGSTPVLLARATRKVKQATELWRTYAQLEGAGAEAVVPLLVVQMPNKPSGRTPVGVHHHPGELAGAPTGRDGPRVRRSRPD